MFYGHIGVAMASKPLVPKISLGLLLVAVTFLDILAGFFSLAGIEFMNTESLPEIPWSHGLFMSLVWSLAVFGASYLVSGNLRNGIVLGLLVFSHWLLDFISHPMGMGEPLPPDLPLMFGGSEKVGLGLYNSSVAIAVVTEFGIFISGAVIYFLKTFPGDRTGRWSPLALFLLLALMPLTMVLPQKLIFIMSIMLLILLPVGNWIDRHRMVLTGKTNLSPEI